jgi:hypothetical protein
MTLTEKIVGVLAILAFILITGVAKADDQKTITPQEFVKTVVEVPGKVGTWFSGEVDKTKEYQAKSWADMKTKWPFTMFKGNSDVTQN